jgi:predicted phosphodiesterase
MRFLIISDTHGNYPLAFRALEMAGPVDLIIHLGDGIEDARLIEEITGRDIIKVPGNCDISASDPGDKARTEKAEIVLYGHTHTGSVELLEGTLFVNPGCLRYKWPTASYALLDVDPAGNASAGIHPIEP